MDFLAYVFLSKLPMVLERSEIIDGKEEPCLIIPTKINQLKKGRQGNWYFICRLAEREANAKGMTHEIQLTYVSREDLQKSYDFGYHKSTEHMGHVYEHDRTPSKKIDRTNRASDIRLDGIIVLSDIPKKLIFRNAENNKRYITKLMFRGLQDNTGLVYMGTLCVDDIPREYIETNPENGKKFIKARLRKMEQLDTYFNTHELVIARPDGDGVQIGLFKEFQAMNSSAQVRPLPPSPPSVPQRGLPNEINGIRF